MKRVIKKLVFTTFVGCFCVGLYSNVAHAGDENELVAALQNTYSACVGIDEQLSDLKKMAGVNTAITGVGTGLGAGALAVGIIKARTDDEIDKLINSLKVKEKKEVVSFTVADFVKNLENLNEDQENSKTQLSAAEQKSKKLGHWRTGLMATNTATNIVGAVIAGRNKTTGELDQSINRCRSAVEQLKRVRASFLFDDIDLSEANEIIKFCNWDAVDLSKINERGRSAMIASIVGATTGAAGTATSAVANTDAIRVRKKDTWERTNKEANLNIASNVLAGTSTAISAIATVFNATQIKAIKDVATVAAQCTEVLK